jgi:hypothetical protein
MSWIEEREQLESEIPEAWNLLRIALEQAAEAFGITEFARAGKVFATAKLINTCVHVVVAATGMSSGRAIDICLDKKGRRVFSRDNGQELESISFCRGDDGNICLVDSAGVGVTTDRACEIFLRPFFFEESHGVR